MHMSETTSICPKCSGSHAEAIGRLADSADETLMARCLHCGFTFSASESRKPRVLLVEDDEMLRGMLRAEFEFTGHVVDEAADGLHALRLVHAKAPDAIVLDVVLPGLDGVAVYERIAADAHARRIPIVIVTGSTLSQSQVEGACVLRKPVRPDDVVIAVQRCLAAESATNTVR